MIEWGDVYKVVEAMAPLYAALIMGYGSVRWLHMFKSDHCDVINRLTCFFIFPFFSFRFVSRVNPYEMNYRFITSDVIAKSIVVIALVAWANFAKKGGLDWSLTTFSLSTLNNTLVVGLPLLRAMYGELGFDIAIQSGVVQSALWFTFLLFSLEFQRTRLAGILRPNGDVDGGGGDVIAFSKNGGSKTTSFKELVKIVSLKLAKNPNSYAWFLGLVWALIAYRWDFKMPGIIDQSIMIMANAGSGVQMFNMGLFMALQEKLVSCGSGLTAYGLVLRFVIGPATSALGAQLLRLHGDVLKVAIIQAALPQSSTSFVYAMEYGLHADVISTVIFLGTIVSLPVLIGYYAALDPLG